MAGEIINLEMSAPVGACQCIKEGVVGLFKNFFRIFKFSIPALFVALGLTLMVAPAIVGFSSVASNLVSLAIGAVIFIAGFWRSVINMIAVSYFAKDFFENREIKSAKTYISYVTPHSKSYIKYYLWMALFGIVYALYYYLIAFIAKQIFDTNVAFTVLMVIICAVAVLPIVLGTFYLSPLFWAYNDKSKPLNSIIMATRAGCKKFLPTLGVSVVYSIIMGILYMVIAYILSFPVTACAVLILKGNTILSLSYAECITAMFTSVVTGYMYYFMLTRFYFDIKNN